MNTVAMEAAETRHWKRQGGLLGAFLALLLIVYYPTYASIVAIWERSETFAHGFIILPICAWLIWRIRDKIAATTPKINYWGIPALVLLGLLWLLAKYVGILAAEQLAATLMIPVLVFTLLGWQASSVMAFPLIFIVFGVPLGEELTPTLINFTADFTVSMIQMVGIPVYREGAYFQLPTGRWEVAAACSGVRYLIAAVTLGVLYAYLNYHSLKKRAIFIVASFIIPIFANGMRAFLIVMLGHFSNMQLAVGVDHLIYGWIFFGIVIALMFYIGSFWRDDDSLFQYRAVDWKFGNLGNISVPYIATIAVTALVLIIWPIKYQAKQQALDFSHIPQLTIAAPSGWTEKPIAPGAWKPFYQGLDREYWSVYQDGVGHEVMLFVGYYAQQRQGAELENYNNKLVVERSELETNADLADRKDELWQAIQGHDLILPSAGIKAPTAVIKNNSNQYLTTYFYYVGGQWVSNKYRTKWYETKARLFGGRNDGAFIAISSPHQDGDNSTAELLKRFTAVALTNIKSSLDSLVVTGE